MLSRDACLAQEILLAKSLRIENNYTPTADFLAVFW